MAMLDYGTILVRDGIIQNRDQMFMLEKTDLGCDIPNKLAFRGDPDRVAFIDGEFFAYAGDMNFMLCRTLITKYYEDKLKRLRKEFEEA